MRIHGAARRPQRWRQQLPASGPTGQAHLAAQLLLRVAQPLQHKLAAPRRDVGVGGQQEGGDHQGQAQVRGRGGGGIQGGVLVAPDRRLHPVQDVPPRPLPLGCRRRSSSPLRGARRARHGADAVRDVRRQALQPGQLPTRGCWRRGAWLALLLLRLLLLLLLHLLLHLLLAQRRRRVLLHGLRHCTVFGSRSPTSASHICCKRKAGLWRRRCRRSLAACTCACACRRGRRRLRRRKVGGDGALLAPVAPPLALRLERRQAAPARQRRALQLLFWVQAHGRAAAGARVGPLLRLQAVQLW